MKTTKFKCKNENLVCFDYVPKSGFNKGKVVWLIELDKGQKKPTDKYYINSVNDSIGEMYSIQFMELKSKEEYINHWKKAYIFPNLRGFGKYRSDNGKRLHKYSYNIDVYDISKKDFVLLVKNIKLLLDKGYIIEYNDDHGVGYFEKTRKKDVYLATHWRYTVDTEEKLNIKGISNFLRDFFDIGISYKKMDDWD